MPFSEYSLNKCRLGSTFLQLHIKYIFVFIKYLLTSHFYNVPTSQYFLYIQ